MSCLTVAPVLSFYLLLLYSKTTGNLSSLLMSDTTCVQGMLTRCNLAIKVVGGQHVALQLHEVRRTDLWKPFALLLDVLVLIEVYEVHHRL